MAVESWRYGDPARVLERKGQDCTHCRSLEQWQMGGRAVTVCGNKDAPQKKRERAPASRCWLWAHKGETTE